PLPGSRPLPLHARRREAAGRGGPRREVAAHAGVRQRAERPALHLPDLRAERLHPAERADRLAEPVCRRIHRRVCLSAKGGVLMIYDDARDAIRELVTLERPFFRPVKLLVVGCSSSEIAGGVIGHASTY